MPKALANRDTHEPLSQRERLAAHAVMAAYDYVQGERLVITNFGAVEDCLLQIGREGTVDLFQLRSILSEHLPGLFRMVAIEFGMTTPMLAAAMEIGPLDGSRFLLSFLSMLKHANEVRRARGRDAQRAQIEHTM